MLNPRQLADENVWHAIPGYEAFSNAPEGGTWRQFSHLSNRKQFSEKIRARASVIEQRVGAHIPECQICKNGGGYSEHLGGPKHWSQLVAFLGENVVDLDRFWNQWSIDGYLAAKCIEGCLGWELYHKYMTIYIYICIYIYTNIRILHRKMPHQPIHIYTLCHSFLSTTKTRL